MDPKSTDLTQVMVLGRVMVLGAGKDVRSHVPNGEFKFEGGP